MRHLLVLVFLAVASLHALEYYGKNLEGYIYPFEVKRYNLNIQNQTLSMAYMDVVPEHPNGHAVVLLHGKNFTGAYWERTAKVLASEGYRVIIPDQIGFGKSSKPEHLQYSFQMFAYNTAALMDHLKITKSHIIGHSMGGMLAVRYALMFPERVEKLILENPIGLEDWQRFIPNPSLDYWYGQELNKNAQAIYRYELESYYDNHWKAEYQPWVDILASFTLGADYPNVAWNQALISEMIVTQPVCYQFDQLKMPVLLIIGQRDRTALGKPLASENVRKEMGNYPVLGRNTAKMIPNATLVELPGIGHLPHIEAFEPYIKAVNVFLSDGKSSE
ncbi:alpha/beta hydrolase [Sulfuricurvum sp.]|uniref:alpha/beta fold hydrolase n=1 Tax=Sulfuricurvum sp. TaxID=2025608 RepID=UPI00260E94C5|nr:alpha/beta hydrolase [Sulfuricurvum sp.]MDD2267781.1 alpha/beta hydrolase [Sulfuricurvum sp.]MDD2784987.1 alpha/beta hydrolase [Sulfuricurvum sp.]